MNDFAEMENWRNKCGFKNSEEKLHIYYDPVVFAKTVRLVTSHPVEVGWNLVVKQYKDGYKVSDIFVYPQKVSEATITVDVPTWALWKVNLSDDAEANLNGHGHSHVNMGTFASIIDENQQHDEVLTKNKGFYLFQIWNKRMDVNSFFYDIDNRIYYENKNIEIIVEDVDEFVEDSYRKVTGKRKKDFYEVGENYGSF